MPNLRPADAFQVNVKTLKNIAAVVCLTALAVPAGVAAQGPSGSHGKSGDQHGQNHKPKHANSKCKHTPRVGINVSGVVVSNDGTNLVIGQAQVSHHAKGSVTPDSSGNVTIPLAGVKGTVPAVGQPVKVLGKIDKPKKGCNETPDQVTQSIAWTKVASDSTDQTDQQQPETQQPAQS